MFALDSSAVMGGACRCRRVDFSPEEEGSIDTQDDVGEPRSH